MSLDQIARVPRYPRSITRCGESIEPSQIAKHFPYIVLTRPRRHHPFQLAGQGIYRGLHVLRGIAHGPAVLWGAQNEYDSAFAEKNYPFLSPYEISKRMPRGVRLLPA